MANNFRCGRYIPNMLPSTEAMKTLFQCDFDGTITHQDASCLMLDAFASGDWRQLLAEYREGKITVGSVQYTGLCHD